MNQELSGIILVALQTVLTAVIPVITAYIITLIKTKMDYLRIAADNEIYVKNMDIIEAAIITAVAYTAQIFVDRLKAENKWTVQEHEEAFEMAKTRTIELLNPELKEYITNTYGNLHTYLNSEIEAEVNHRKI